MTTSPSAVIPTHLDRRFLVALAGNFVWVNASEIWRYLAVVRPMLLQVFPGRPGIAPLTLPAIAIWTIWDTILILASTGFYWIYLTWTGPVIRHALLAATALTATVFGLLWLAVFNMGLAPPQFLWTAVPLAWVEQVVAAFIVGWAMARRAHARL